MYDSISKKIISINGLDLNGMTDKKITKLLGKPNKTTHDKKTYVFDYFLAPHCGFSEEGCYRWVLEISFEENHVKTFYSSFIKT